MGSFIERESLKLFYRYRERDPSFSLKRENRSTTRLKRVADFRHVVCSSSAFPQRYRFHSIFYYVETAYRSTRSSMESPCSPPMGIPCAGQKEQLFYVDGLQLVRILSACLQGVYFLSSLGSPSSTMKLLLVVGIVHKWSISKAL